ncbi:MAG: peptidoglycan bridge formation glycyltransferase FemA/FemB family protein [Treponema sp.]|nr:peptidoglycan bridge formation glycyltransferase FemA/FemB family protein [Treponema sp.]
MIFEDLILIEKKSLQEYSEKISRFLQTDFWATFKSKHDWQYKFFDFSFIIKNDNINIDFQEKKVSISVSVLIRRIAKFFYFAYIPMGPDITNELSLSYEDYLKLLNLFAKKLKKILPKNLICIRMDPPIEFENLNDKIIAQKNIRKVSTLKKTQTDIQPSDTVLLNITQDEDTILANMKSKWRYNINLARKKGVEVFKGSINDMDIFYELYNETSKRDGIALHSKNYYKSLMELSKNQNDIKINLYIASHEGEKLASIITLFSKTEAVYLYGASSNKKRNLMPTYLLQWNAILDAKNFGSKVYDFYGIPPTDDEKHPMHGLYKFKTGFGGKIIHRIGSVDFICSPIYVCFVFLENLRNFYHKKIKKILAGRL